MKSVNALGRLYQMARKVSDSKQIKTYYACVSRELAEYQRLKAKVEQIKALIEGDSVEKE